MNIEEGIKRLNGGIVKYSRAGGATGSILLIDTDRNISLWIWCYWEISKSGVVIATADDDTTAVVGKIAIAARLLEGKRILETAMNPEWYHLGFRFEDDYELFVGCESQPPEESHPLDNWELAIEDLNINYTVTCQFDIKQEPYS